MESIGVQDIPKTIKIARENAFLSNYEVSDQYFKKVLTVMKA